MRRVIIVAAIAMAALLSMAAPSHASTSWPAKCHNFKCVNAHLNALHKAVKAQTANLKGFEANFEGFINCLTIDPYTQYPNFLADDGVTSISGLDFTASGDTVDVWSVEIPPGTCGTGTTAASVRAPTAVPLARFFH